jgi:hemerythrin-like domain-containing protein
MQTSKLKPTEVLKQEHEAIKLALEILEKICQKLDGGGKVSAKDLEKIVEFIKIFADKCHHGKEEDLLFVEMEKAGVPREGGPIEVMLTEHNIGRDYVKKMSEAVAKIQKGESKAPFSQFSQNAKGYIELLTEHINKEDSILYPIVDTHLAIETQNELLEKFEKVEKERIGHGEHEEFHHLLHKLKETYLK